MEVCILKFKRADKAEESLARLVRERGDQEGWLHEIGVLKRPLVGRISIRATYDDSPEIREGDVAKAIQQAGKWTGYLVGSLAGPLRARVAELEFKRRLAPAAREIAQLLLGIDDMTEMLPRGSSALVLVASTDICDRMVQVFAPEGPEVMRRGVSAEVQDILQEFDRQATMGPAAAAE